MIRPRSTHTRQKPARVAQVDLLEQRRMLSGSLSTLTRPLRLDSDADDVQSIDGTGNNEANSEFGSTNEFLGRVADANYADGVGEPNDADLPSARTISNVVASQSESEINDRYLTDLTWLWGQFLDHDIDLSLTTGEVGDAEHYDINVPTGDPHFDPFGTGEVTIPLERSEYDDSSGVREQINNITAFIDGSNVYGSDDVRAAALRTFEGGKLKTSDGDLLPFNEDGLPNAGGTSDSLFLAGDIRANENVGLASLHTLFVREHNRLADEIARRQPSLDDEGIYQQARRIVISEIQAVTYNEFLPALLGFDAITPYRGYDPSVNPNIVNEFSTAAYRLGHSLLSPELLRIGADGNVIEDGHLSLAEAFFNPGEVVEEGIDSVLRGATVGLAQELDTQIIDDVRNFLFGPPGAGGLDLASLNIQRGRDHGLASYNQTRLALGLDAADSFADISSDPEVQAKLEEAYGDVDSVELWVGLLSEDHVPNASVGETMQLILADQFTRLRDGDRFYYENVFSGNQLRELQGTTLKDIIERNTDIEGLQDNVFFDAGVVIHQLPTHGRATNTRVTLTDNHVILRDMNTRKTIEIRKRDDVKQVMVVGSGRLVDRVTVDTRRTDDPLEGGVVVVGGRGPGDRLALLGSRGVDVADVTEGTILFNDHSVYHSGIDRIDLRTLRSGDVVNIGQDVKTPIWTYRHNRPRRLRGDHARVAERPNVRPADVPRRQDNASRHDDERLRDNDDLIDRLAGFLVSETDGSRSPLLDN